ncbi:hypothetical protein FQA39_LY00520 [Lamprigera yunnana]|nr:hypothetical protein FQA39_LY00520 [Lamprigera yunnana]
MLEYELFNSIRYISKLVKRQAKSKEIVISHYSINNQNEILNTATKALNKAKMSKLKRKNDKNCPFTQKEIEEEVLRIELALSDSESGQDDPSYNIDNNEVSEVEHNLEFIGEEGDDEVPIEDTNLKAEEEETGCHPNLANFGKQLARNQDDLLGIIL